MAHTEAYIVRVIDHYCWIAGDVIALQAKPLDVKIADRRYVNASKNTDSDDIERIFKL